MPCIKVFLLIEDCKLNTFHWQGSCIVDSVFFNLKKQFMDSISVVKIKESERGCGKRSSGYYLRVYNGTDGDDMDVIPLFSCPVCGSGIKRSRNYRVLSKAEVNRFAVLGGSNPPLDESYPDDMKVFLVYGDVTHYPTLEEFMTEGEKMGYSRTLRSSCPTGVEDFSDVYAALAYSQVSESQAKSWGWEMRTVKVNPKTRTERQEILVKGFDVDEHGKPVFKETWQEFHGFIFLIKSARIEKFLGENEEVITNHNINRAKRRMTFVQRVNVVGAGGVQTRPSPETGIWEVVQGDGMGEEVLEIAEIEYHDFNEREVRLKTRYKNKK